MSVVSAVLLQTSEAMADWLISCGVETVAMESTSVDWIPVFQMLEARGLEVFLVNAHHVKTVPGRKSDVRLLPMVTGIAPLMVYYPALLSGEDQIVVLRSYLRQRENLIKSTTTHIQRMQKALTQMNLQLHRVISDVTGVTGMRIIRALVAGERNPDRLAAMVRQSH